MTRPFLPLAERFALHTIPEPNSGCLLWDGNWDTKGYGQINVDGKQRAAHRVAWELENGPIPPGMHVLHKCDVPCCVNARDHLWLGTHQDNVADMARKMRGYKSKSGMPYGVQKFGNRYVAAIRVNGKKKNLGSFRTVEDAASVAIAAWAKRYE